MKPYSLKSRLEKLKPQLLTKGKKQEKSSCKVRRDAPECANPVTKTQALNQFATRLSMIAEPAAFAVLSFMEASEAWLEEKAIYKKPGTINCYKDYLVRLKSSFSHLRLNEISIGHIMQYQRDQKAADYHPASVNHDIGIIQQLLRRAGLWHKLEPHYHPLPLPAWEAPQVLTEEEQRNFFKLAASSPDWVLAYWVATLTNNTTASGKELRLLQMKDVDMDADPPTIYVPTDVKTRFRVRPIPLIPEAAIVMHCAIVRARSVGSVKPEHYLFPIRPRRNQYDPTRAASESWLRYQWKKMVDEAMERRIIRFRITPHRLRHQIVTELLENGEAEEVVCQLAGWIDKSMFRQYSHTRIKAKYNALQRLAASRKPPENVPSFAQKKFGQGA